MRVTERTRRFVNDTRGAAMLTGLFLSFFLVGALWFLLGIADSVVFRNRMQEATDHAAFTSAALHAKGMNFISAINLVMLALVVVHIVLGLIHDVTLVVCIVTGAGCVAWFGARDIYTGYAKVLKPVLTGLHYVEAAAAYGYPYVGLVKSIQVGDRYGKQHHVGDVDVFAVSPSMVPGALVKSTRIGLPVANQPMNQLCVKAADWAFDKVITSNGYDAVKAHSKLDAIVGGARKVINKVTFGRWGGPSSEEEILAKLAKLLQGAVVNRYCNAVADDHSTKDFVDTVDKGNEQIKKKNDEAQKEFNKGNVQGPVVPMQGVDLSGLPLAQIDPGFDPFWGSDGPLYVDGSAKNGNFFMQVWAINFRPRMNDTNEGKVKLASRDTSGGTTDEGPLGYFAQAEFYYDCDSTWDADTCNAAPDHDASYSIKWRARLRHVAIPQLGELVGGYLYDLVTKSDLYEALRKFVTDDNVLYEKLSRGPLSTALIDELKKKVDAMVSDGEAAARAKLVNGIDDGQDAVLDGVYH